MKRVSGNTVALLILLFVVGGLTGQASDTDKGYFFVHLSDPQYGFLDGDRSHDREVSMMDTVVGFVNRMKPPFIVVTGDFVNQSHNDVQVAAWKESLSAIDPDIQVYMVPGNHDIGNKPDKAAYDRYESFYGDTKFSFRYGNDAFIGIDSNPLKNGDSIRERDQYEWLETQLDKVRDAGNLFVFMHHPLFLKKVTEKEKYSNLNQAMRDRYLSLFKKYGVDVVLTGHYHNTASAEVDGVRMFTAGAVGRALGSGFSGVNIVRVGDRRVNVSYVELARLPHMSEDPVHCSYKGLVMAGYQGWFNAEGDGLKRGFYHYKDKRTGTFRPGAASVDMWPDMSEYAQSYPTEFRMEDGSVATVFSSADKSTTDLHFRWMREYGLDGVFMQRFVVEIKGKSGQRHFNQVLNNAVKASVANGRAMSLMYDLSGMNARDWRRVLDDVDNLSHSGLFTPMVNPAYLYHNGRPLVAVWGAGFNDRRRYGLDEIDSIVTGLRNRGYSVLLGVPTCWRTLTSDTESDPRLHDIISRCDIVMPWFVGRYDEQSFDRHMASVTADMEWCIERNIDYVPLAFPGFTWKNMKGPDATSIPRNGGSFLQKQLDAYISGGASMIYVAMFDEIDEGTAIFKCAQIVPIPSDGSIFVPSDTENDRYLRIVGKASEALKKRESKKIIILSDL